MYCVSDIAYNIYKRSFRARETLRALFPEYGTRIRKYYFGKLPRLFIQPPPLLHRMNNIFFIESIFRQTFKLDVAWRIFFHFEFIYFSAKPNARPSHFTQIRILNSKGSFDNIAFWINYTACEIFTVQNFLDKYINVLALFLGCLLKLHFKRSRKA